MINHIIEKFKKSKHQIEYTQILMAGNVEIAQRTIVMKERKLTKREIELLKHTL